MWQKAIVFVIVVLVFVITVAILYGAKRWRSNTRELHAEIEAARLQIVPEFYDSREVDGILVSSPWQCSVWDYELRDGMMIPLEGEVLWLLPEGSKPYWRGRIQRIEYEYANE